MLQPEGNAFDPKLQTPYGNVTDVKLVPAKASLPIVREDACGSNVSKDSLAQPWNALEDMVVIVAGKLIDDIPQLVNALPPMLTIDPKSKYVRYWQGLNALPPIFRTLLPRLTECRFGERTKALSPTSITDDPRLT